MSRPSSRQSRPATPSEHNNNQETPITPTPGTQHSPKLSSASQTSPEPHLHVTRSDSSTTSAPLIIITEADPEVIDQQNDRAAPIPLRTRSLASQQTTEQASSQPPTPASTPDILQSHTEPQQAPTVAMSSAGSSPNTTTTSGSSGTTSGSNPGYHLPYAPFPYPMPGNARGGQGNQGNTSGNSGK